MLQNRIQAKYFLGVTLPPQSASAVEIAGQNPIQTADQYTDDTKKRLIPA
jgi:hypothetical protein